MVVLHTCKNEKNLIKMKGLECLQDYDFFFGRSAATYCEVSGGILPKFELIHAFMIVHVTGKNERDPIKNEGARVLTRFSPL